MDRVVAYIDYILRESLTNLVRGGWMNMVLLTTFIIALTILGSIWQATRDIETFAKNISSNVTIMVYLNDDADIIFLQQEMAKLPGIKNITYVSKDEAWSKMKEELQGKVDLASIVDANPLPDAFRITLDKADHSEEVAAILPKLEGVMEVKYGQKLVKKLLRLNDMIKVSGLISSIFFGIAIVALMMNTIRLTILARKEEIQVMQLVGASHWFIQWPFIIEGLIIGISSSLVAISLIFIGREYLINLVQDTISFLPLLTSLKESEKIYLGILFIGVVVGMLGSYYSVKRYLKT